MTSVFSCGGGRQSAAIIGLICRGILQPPDHIVMVDTGRERSSTWRYAEAVLIPELSKVGITLQIAKKQQYATVDLWGGKEKKTLLLPAFTDVSGTIGKLPTFCSVEWKRRVLGRFLREQYHLKNWITWLGMSTDEMKRVRLREGDTGNRNEYPLIFGPRPMSTAQCIDFVTKELCWPEAPKSTCYICSNQSDEQWSDMKRDDPQDFKEACRIDNENRQVDPNVYLHASGKPLEDVDFESLQTLVRRGTETCDSGYCMN